jgi:hypothetical protein
MDGDQYKICAVEIPYPTSHNQRKDKPMNEKAKSNDRFDVAFGTKGPIDDELKIKGHFSFVCKDKDGTVVWQEELDNLLTQTGKALLLDITLAGSAYTAAEYMGLISSASFGSISGGDTMASHATWLEAGTSNAPTYSGGRIACVWSTATVSGASAYSATKALSAGLVFTFTGTGTVQGAFIVGGSGASATVGNTGGTLFAEGTFSTPQPVVATNTLTVSYSVTLT